jgi:hypothetical protein
MTTDLTVINDRPQFHARSTRPALKAVDARARFSVSLNGVKLLEPISRPTAMRVISPQRVSFAPQGGARILVVPRGSRGFAGAGVHTFRFAWGDATPASLLTVPAGRMILAVQLVIDEAFDGSGAALSIGDAVDPQRLLARAQIDPTVVASYENAPCVRVVADTPVLLTIVPGTGASTGSGVVSLFLE